MILDTVRAGPRTGPAVSFRDASGKSWVCFDQAVSTNGLPAAARDARSGIRRPLDHLFEFGPPEKPGARRFSGGVAVPGHAGRKPGGTPEKPGARRFYGHVAVPGHAGRKPGGRAEALPHTRHTAEECLRALRRF